MKIYLCKTLTHSILFKNPDTSYTMFHQFEWSRSILWGFPTIRRSWDFVAACCMVCCESQPKSIRKTLPGHLSWYTSMTYATNTRFLYNVRFLVPTSFPSWLYMLYMSFVVFVYRISEVDREIHNSQNRPFHIVERTWILQVYLKIRDLPNLARNDDWIFPSIMI